MKFSATSFFVLPAVAQVKASSIRGVHHERKLLKQLVGFGGVPPSSRFPLKECEGDCDENSDCDVGLICFQRADPGQGKPWPEVPGCIGGSAFAAKTDFCIVAPVEGAEDAATQAATSTFDPSSPPTEAGFGESSFVPTDGMYDGTMSPTSASYWDLPELEFLSNEGNLDGLPLGICQGDCDKDRDCLDDLVCFQRNYNEPVPGCRGLGLSSMDYCILPPPPEETPVVTMSPTSMETAAATEMIVALEEVGDENVGLALGLCQGDCDVDDDCLDDLICFQRNFFEPIPGCAGRGRASYDYCIINPDAVESTISLGMDVGVGVASAPSETPPMVAAVEAPTLAPPVLPQLTTVDQQGGGKNNKGAKLGLCQGECKKDDDCEDGLVCLIRLTSTDEVPGCDGIPNGAEDYCVNPTV